MKATEKKPAIGRNRMYALSDEEGNVTNKIDDLRKTAEKFYTKFVRV